MTDLPNVQPESRAETLMASPDRIVKVREAFGVDSERLADADPEIRVLRQLQQFRRVALGSTQIHGQALQGRKRGRYAASAPRAATPGNVPGRLRI